MSTIEPKKTLYVEYPVPPSQFVSIRVAASQPVNVYAVDDQTMKDYLAEKRPPLRAFARSEVGTKHEMQVRLPVFDKWYLVIENPWNAVVEAGYTVEALSPAYRGVTGSMGLGSTSTAATVLDGGFTSRR